MTQYFRQPGMQEGTGPFICHNCGKKLAVKLKGSYEAHFHCPRCHAYIIVRVKEPLKWGKNSDAQQVSAEGGEKHCVSG